MIRMETIISIRKISLKKLFVFSDAVSDLMKGLFSFRIFGRLGWQDIKLRYKRSTLGPFWITLSTMIMIYCMGVVYANLFKVDLTVFFPYLSSGMIIWQFLLALILESLDSFVEASAMIKQVNLPFSLYVYKVIYRNVLVLAHQIVGLIPIFIYFNTSINFPLMIVGVTFFMIIVGFGSLLMALVGVRYRDVKPIVSSVLGVLFFITPVMWMPGMISGRKMILIHYNPIYHMINLIRNPLLGHPIPLSSWKACSLFLIGLMILSLFFFGKI